MLLISMSMHSLIYAQGTVINGDRSIVGSLCVGSAGAPVDRLSLCAAPVASATRALLNLSNTTLSGGSASGTYIGANPAACAGNFWDFQLGNAARSVLTCAGSIGLGIAVPGAVLHIQSSVSTTNTFIDSTATSVQSLIGFRDSATVQWFIGSRNAVDAPNDRFSFFNAGGAAERVSILQGGNVGIGTTSPNEGLEMGTTLNIRVPNIKSTTGVRYVCVNTDGTLTSQSAACVGT